MLHVLEGGVFTFVTLQHFVCRMPRAVVDHLFYANVSCVAKIHFFPLPNRIIPCQACHMKACVEACRGFANRPYKYPPLLSLLPVYSQLGAEASGNY